jgi:hypothetical protein
MKITKVTPKKKCGIPCRYVNKATDGQSQSGHTFAYPPESGIVIALDSTEALSGVVFISKKELKKYV